MDIVQELLGLQKITHRRLFEYLEYSYVTRNGGQRSGYGPYRWGSIPGSKRDLLMPIPVRYTLRLLKRASVDPLRKYLFYNGVDEDSSLLKRRHVNW
jgi:hypothetical protein